MSRRGAADPDEDAPAPIRTQIMVPAELAVRLVCPSCGLDELVTAKLSARVTKDTDGTGALALRTRAPKVQHVCDQLSMGLVEGARIK